MQRVITSLVALSVHVSVVILEMVFSALVSVIDKILCLHTVFPRNLAVLRFYFRSHLTHLRVARF